MILTLLACLPLLAAAATSAQPRVNTGQYKRIHQDALRLILDGKAESAVPFLNDALAKLGDDAETHFMLVLAHTKLGHHDQAGEHVDKALAAGLPPGRFIAGPRHLLPTPAQVARIGEIRKAFATKPVNGPMLGDITATGAKVWVRTADEAPVRVAVRPVGTDAWRTSAPATSSAASDYTAVVQLTDLNPDTQHEYIVRIADADAAQQAPPGQRFRTLPANGRLKFTLAFGGGAGYVPQHEHMWTTIDSFKPDALVLLGDNVYIDDPKSGDMQRYCYYRRFGRPEFRKLVAHTPVYTIWDDHDFSTNDSWGGPAIDEPDWKPDVWRVFTQNWVNRGYGGGAEQPGCWYAFRIGDVDFIMLDGRYYRTNPRVDEPSMLGPAQKRWLFDTLKQCAGTFKVICSPVPWTFHAKGDSRDTWNGFKAERDQIFGFLKENNIEGVLLMSADRHRSDLWKIPRDDAYTLYEFNSSRLTNQHVHGEMKHEDTVFSYNKKQSFGLVTFDLTAADPAVTYEVVTIDGDKVHGHTVRRSQLK